MSTLRIAVMDNNDSFTYNLVQYLAELGARPLVRRNDAATPDQILALEPHGILISPGPGDPSTAGISTELIARAAGLMPVLGVCLGHQCLAQVYGGHIMRASRIMHGKTSAVIHDGRGVFARIPSPFTATRYHSLIVDPATLPADLEIRAHTSEDEIMAIKHRAHETWGVQFHPESILTVEGKRLIENFLGLCAGDRTGDANGGSRPALRDLPCDHPRTGPGTRRSRSLNRPLVSRVIVADSHVATMRLE
jgi:anthranilate synthase/aminodeoxychorismate synthase-like glutamine amidotransferase